MITGKKVHFVGVGGIGMSAVARFFVELGATVSGSDRGADRPENARILDPLRRAGITVYPQDGSFAAGGLPDYLVYSTAVEDGNPDFAAAPGLPHIHRATALEWAIRRAGCACSIAVAGSCGKSSVTAAVTEALCNSGADPAMLNGALCKRFMSARLAGNFRPGDGSFLVFEADESDKSLTAFSPDYAVILNLGHDHYPLPVLAAVFAEFLHKVRRGAVLERQVFEAVKTLLPPKLPVAVFESGFSPSGHAIRSRNGREIVFASGETLGVPQPGFHAALNALAVKTLFEMIGIPDPVRCLARFDGVWRRTDFAGKTPRGAAVYDDYAHNPEKIAAAVESMHEVVPGRVFAVFQPHGYGPLGFMRDALFEVVGAALRPGDEFRMLEPFYAGGTSSHRPTAAEVVAGYRALPGGERFSVARDRESLRGELRAATGAGDAILILGARDNSLSDYAKSYTSLLQ